MLERFSVFVGVFLMTKIQVELRVQLLGHETNQFNDNQTG